jgi:ankyrin repeat protein
MFSHWKNLRLETKPLMFAAAEGQKEVVQALLQNNANTTVKDKDGETARDFAEKNGHREVATMLGLVP